MSEPEANDEQFEFVFQFYGHPGTPFRTLRVRHGDAVDLAIRYPHTKQGLAQASALAARFPHVWVATQREQGVWEAMRDIDSELDDLLNNGDESV